MFALCPVLQKVSVPAYADKETGKLWHLQHLDRGDLITEDTSRLCSEGNRRLLEKKMDVYEPLFSFFLDNQHQE